MTRSEHGAGSVLAVAMMGLLVAVTVAVSCGVAVVAAHREAQSAADLASLAAASALRGGKDACASAAAIAGENRAELRACRVEGWTVSVAVRADARLPIGTVRLPARARAGPVG